jgi:hypothetical protein
MTKCDTNGCCSHLGKRLGNGGKGFAAKHTINSANQTAFLGVAYKMKDKGLMLNYCPFCGGRPGNFMQPSS